MQLSVCRPLSHIGFEGVSPVIFNLVNRLMRVVDLIPLTFHFQGKRHVVIQREAVYVARRRSGHLAEENEIYNVRGAFKL